MFRNLPSFEPTDGLLIELAATMVESTGGLSPGGQDVADPVDNSAISAGYTYLGQSLCPSIEACWRLPGRASHLTAAHCGLPWP